MLLAERASAARWLILLALLGTVAVWFVAHQHRAHHEPPPCGCQAAHRPHVRIVVQTQTWYVR